MEIEAKSENKRLNTMVAVTVLIVSLFLAVTKLKDDNLVRAMEFVKADSIDLWNEYQAERIKLHGDENDTKLLRLVRAQNTQDLAAEQKRLAEQIAKYTGHSAGLADRARSEDARYEALKFRHEQFDMEDGILSIALALTAVAALTELYWLLATGWGFAAFGITMGVAGFLGWSLHPEFLTRVLG
ncbi:MAG: DUF4337 family protein [Rhizomicrobium sp.]